MILKSVTLWILLPSILLWSGYCSWTYGTNFTIKFYLVWPQIKACIIFSTISVLPNQTWVCLPTVQHYWHQVMVKESTELTADTKQGEGAAHAQKTRTSHGFQGRVFKATLGLGIAGCVISSWTFFWLVGGGIVTGWCFRNLNHQAFGSNQSAV